MRQVCMFLTLTYSKINQICTLKLSQNSSLRLHNQNCYKQLYHRSNDIIIMINVATQLINYERLSKLYHERFTR